MTLYLCTGCTLLHPQQRICLLSTKHGSYRTQWTSHLRPSAVVRATTCECQTIVLWCHVLRLPYIVPLVDHATPSEPSHSSLSAALQPPSKLPGPPINLPSFPNNCLALCPRLGVDRRSCSVWSPCPALEALKCARRGEMRKIAAPLVRACSSAENHDCRGRARFARGRASVRGRLLIARYDF